MEKMRERSEILRREQDVRRSIIEQERLEKEIERKFEEEAKKFIED